VRPRVEVVAGARTLTRKVKKFAPRFLAIVGMQSYRFAFERPDAKIGLQPDRIGATRIWVLPNPSGLNAHYKPADLVALYRELREAAAKR
jgi:TDG/mug DNA glycosylase family protein